MPWLERDDGSTYWSDDLGVGGGGTGQQPSGAAHGGGLPRQPGLLGGMYTPEQIKSFYPVSSGSEAPYEAERVRFINADIEQRAKQDQLTQMLQEQAAGKGPSVAQMQLVQGRNEAQAAAMGMQASARGGNAALASRQAAQSSAAANQTAAGQAATLRAQEMLAARQQLGGHLAGIRGTELQGQDLIQKQQQVMSGMASQADVEAANRAQRTQGGLISAGGAVIGGLIDSSVRAKTDRKPMSDAERERMISEAEAMMVQRSRGGPSARFGELPDANRYGGGAQYAAFGEEPEQGGEEGRRAAFATLPERPPTARFGDITTESYRYRPEFGGMQTMGPNAQAVARAPDPEVRSLAVRDPRTGMLALDGARAGVVSLGAVADQGRELEALRNRQAAMMKQMEQMGALSRADVQMLDDMQIGGRNDAEDAYRRGVPRRAPAY